MAQDGRIERKGSVVEERERGVEREAEKTERGPSMRIEGKTKGETKELKSPPHTIIHTKHTPK